MAGSLSGQRAPYRQQAHDGQDEAAKNPLSHFFVLFTVINSIARNKRQKYRTQTCSSVLSNSFESVQSLLSCLSSGGLFVRFDRSVVTLRRASVTPPSPPSDFLLSINVFPCITCTFRGYCEYRISSEIARNKHQKIPYHQEE